MPTSFQKLKSIAAIAAGLLAWNSVAAQTILLQENISVVKKTKAAKGEKCQRKKPNNHFSKNKLKGIVKDQNGEALIGANILLESNKSNKGTVTDIDGKFELEIPNDWESFEVTFSYVGYETRVIEFDKKDILNGKNAEVKMMEADNHLEEVIVTGYGVPIIKGEIVCGGTLTGELVYTYLEDSEKEKSEKEILQPISNIYPNPFVDYVNVVLDLEKDQPYLFHLYNANGQLLWAKTYELAKGKQELRLDFSAVRMAQGNHFLRITDGNREIQTKKIIKVNTKGQMPQVPPVKQ